ncbi:MAG TPA: glycosyltransferase [Microlunatus sp.]|nr:glycosyltransferase [Microlunatus sp.]
MITHTLDEERQAIPRHFIARLGPARARDLTTIAREWSADLMVSDDVDYGAVVSAEAVGVPHISEVVSAAGGLAAPELIAGPLEELRATAGLAAENGLLMLQRSLKLNQFPPALRGPAVPLIGRVMNYRSGPVPPQPSASDSGRAYVTLGTIFNTESGDLLARMTSSVASCPWGVSSVLVATGEHVNPSELGPQPGTVTVHRFVRQREALAACSVVVCHGGSGTVLDALRYGLPMILLPLGADQPLNAARCRDLGCAVVLRADQATSADITDAVSEVMTDVSYRDAARQMQTELRRLPSIGAIIPVLERLN